MRRSPPSLADLSADRTDATMPVPGLRSRGRSIHPGSLQTHASAG